MKNKLLIERFQKLAGIKPLYENEDKINNPNFSSVYGSYLEDIGDGMYRQSETGFVFDSDGVAEVQMGDYDSEQDYELDLEKGMELLRKAGHKPQATTRSGMTIIKIALNKNMDESYTQYAAIIRDLYPGKSWEELTPSERFKVRSTYEDFN